MVNLSIKEIKKNMPNLYKAIKILGEDDNQSIDSAYIFEGVNKAIFRQADTFLKSIRRPSVASVCKKYHLLTNLPSLEDSQTTNALEEFCVGEQRFAESLERKFKGAYYAQKILGECFEGNWDDVFR